MLAILLDYAQNCCLLKIVDELIDVFLVAQVITPWKEILYLKFVIKQAIVPQVLAKTGLGSQLTVIRKMVVPLLVLHLVNGPLFVSYVILDVKVACGRSTWHR
jgi:hypothetical protein